jgi:hypothetical protein
VLELVLPGGVGAIFCRFDAHVDTFARFDAAPSMMLIARMLASMLASILFCFDAARTDDAAR